MTTPPNGDSGLAAWRDVTARLTALGDEVVGAPYPAHDFVDRDALIEHVAEQLLCWVGWSVFHADPRRPFFHRQNDLVTQWGGPNADNVYRHARVDPSRRYRIRGRMHSCEEFIVAVRCGFMHQPKWGTVFEGYASDFGIGEGDEFELLVGGPEQPGRWIPLPDGAVMVSFREYYFDWREAEPAMLTIECLDDEPAADDLPDRPDLTARLADAIAGIEHSVRNWNSYLNDNRAQGIDNQIAPPLKVAKGLSTARYAFSFWDLADDQALVFESTVPDARYWSGQLYEMGTYELVDLVEHHSALNHRQSLIDADGRVRYVISARDPGVANWLDTGGQRSGLFTFRWFWPQSDPSYSTRVVPVGDVRAALPSDTRLVTPEERRDAMAGRRRHLAWRFRT